jgi:hypothetical protein
MQLYVDMDGVLADFDTHYRNCFGMETNKKLDNADWKLVREHRNFYLTMPPMQDMWPLWSYIEKYNPIILTGIPESVSEATNNKTAWAFKHFGPNANIICCRSSVKSLHCKPGDILIDDWEKYMKRWTDKGGVWITHTSAQDTINKLGRMGL